MPHPKSNLPWAHELVPFPWPKWPRVELMIQGRQITINSMISSPGLWGRGLFRQDGSWQRGSLLLLVAILPTICPTGWRSTAASCGHLRSPGFSHIPNSWILIAHLVHLLIFQSSFSSYAKVFILGPLLDFFLTPDFLILQIVGEGLCYRI